MCGAEECGLDLRMTRRTAVWTLEAAFFSFFAVGLRILVKYGLQKHSTRYLSDTCLSSPRIVATTSTRPERNLEYGALAPVEL
jgi:hypothetical protein